VRAGLAYPLAVVVAPGRRGRRPGGRGWTRLAPALLALLLLTGCKVGISVEVEAGAGGEGHVRATVTLDEEAAAQVPDLAEQLRVDDLQAAGWEIDGPTPIAGGGARLQATKAFASDAGAARALQELGGPSGPFGTLRLRLDRGFWKTRSALEGTVDLSAGLGVFGDETLAQQLGGANLGVDPAAVERELGRPLAEVFTFEVLADLPGRVTSNSSAGRDGEVVWPVALGTTLPIRATSEAWNVERLAAVGVAVVSGAGLLLVLVRRSRRISWG
jgi:hypothetical protein